MEKIVSRIAALGVPGLVLTVAIGATGLHGAAALTCALAAIGPGGMIMGLVTLGVIGIISAVVTEKGLEAVVIAVVRELCSRGETLESIEKKVEKYPVSKGLKAQLLQEISKLKLIDATVAEQYS